MKQFNICPSCMYLSTCVLTAQKDNVWSCSEFDEETSKDFNLETLQDFNLENLQKPEQTQKQKRELELV